MPQVEHLLATLLISFVHGKGQYIKALSSEPLESNWPSKLLPELTLSFICCSEETLSGWLKNYFINNVWLRWKLTRRERWSRSGYFQKSMFTTNLLNRGAPFDHLKHCFPLFYSFFNHHRTEMWIGRARATCHQPMAPLYKCFRGCTVLAPTFWRRTFAANVLRRDSLAPIFFCPTALARIPSGKKNYSHGWGA